MKGAVKSERSSLSSVCIVVELGGLRSQQFGAGGRRIVSLKAGKCRRWLDTAADTLCVRWRWNRRCCRRRLISAVPARAETDNDVGRQERRASRRSPWPVGELKAVRAGPWRRAVFSVGRSARRLVCTSPVHRRDFYHIVVTARHSVAPCNRSSTSASLAWS